MPLPLLAAALGAGAIRGIAGFFGAKHAENVQKNLIGQAYGLASKQLGYRQANVRQDLGESIDAKGLGGGGQAGNTVAGQERTNTEGQLGLERQDLDLQRRSELAGVKAGFANDALGSITGAVGTAASVYSAGSMIHGAFGLPANNGGLPAGQAVGGSIGEPGMSNADFHVG